MLSIGLSRSGEAEGRVGILNGADASVSSINSQTDSIFVINVFHDCTWKVYSDFELYYTSSGWCE